MLVETLIQNTPEDIPVCRCRGWERQNWAEHRREEDQSSSLRQSRMLTLRKLRHPYPAAIRADPGRAIADGPHIFFKTVIANLKAAGAIPAKGQFPPTTMTLKFLGISTAARFFRLLPGHDQAGSLTSAPSQARYSLLPAIIGVAIISATS